MERLSSSRIGKGERFAATRPANLLAGGPGELSAKHLSYVGRWREGAALSAHEALKIVQSMAAERAASRAA